MIAPERHQSTVFLGFVRSVPTFSPRLHIIAALLTKRFRNGHPKNFPTPEKHESQTLNKLIRIISSKIVLALSRPDLPFINDTNASDYQFEVVLFQVYANKKLKPIKCFARSFNSHE